MADDAFDYVDRAQNALLGVVRDVLRQTAENGLPGEHHFYISFRTQADDVRMSDNLRDQHPQEMTIVLQNQFENLQISDKGFSVQLNFNQKPEELFVPFTALSKFYDPTVSFGLMFEEFDETDENTSDKLDKKEKESANKESANVDSLTPPKQTKNADNPEDKDKPKEGEVVSLDSFRNK